MDTTTSPPPILARLAALDALVRRIGPERVSHVDTMGNVHFADENDGHAAAAMLGLPRTGVHRPDKPNGFTTYHGHIDGHPVTVFASAPRHVVVDTDTGERLTPPLPLPLAGALVAGEQSRRVHTEQVTP